MRRRVWSFLEILPTPPPDLGDVEEAVDDRADVDERAVLGHADHLAPEHDGGREPTVTSWW